MPKSAAELQHVDPSDPLYRALVDTMVCVVKHLSKRGGPPPIQVLQAGLAGLTIIANRNDVRRPFAELLATYSEMLRQGGNPALHAVEMMRKRRDDAWPPLGVAVS